MSAAHAQPQWWGWHQLAEGWSRRLVTRAGVAPGDLVLDVGAGTGAITRRLVDAGAHVIAVELHPQRVAALRQRFAGERVTIVRADAADLRLPRRPFTVVANPPFGITTALLRRLLSPGSRLQRADLVVPRHVATRWASGRGSGSRRWSATFDVAVTDRIPRHAFRPPPREGAAVLTIVRRYSAKTQSSLPSGSASTVHFSRRAKSVAPRPRRSSTSP